MASHSDPSKDPGVRSQLTDLVRTYQTTHQQALLADIAPVARQAAGMVLYGFWQRHSARNPRHIRPEAVQDLIDDIVGGFLERLLTQRLVGDPWTALRSEVQLLRHRTAPTVLGRGVVQDDHPIMSEWSDWGLDHQADTDDPTTPAEAVTMFPYRTQALILYLSAFPEARATIDRVSSSHLEQTVITVMTAYLRRDAMADPPPETTKLPATISSECAKLVFLALAHQHDPAFLVLCFLLQDVGTILEVCDLLGGLDIPIPSRSTVQSWLRSAATIEASSGPSPAEAALLHPLLALWPSLPWPVPDETGDRPSGPDRFTAFLSSELERILTVHRRATEEILARIQNARPDEIVTLYRALHTELVGQLRWVELSMRSLTTPKEEVR